VAEAQRWCQELLALSPTCLKILQASFEAQFDYLWGSGKQICRLMAPHYFHTGEQQAGAAAFLERRRPNFASWR